MRGLFANSNMSRREAQAAGGSIRRRLLSTLRRRPFSLSDGFIQTPPSLSRERRMYHSSLYALGLIAILGGKPSRKRLGKSRRVSAGATSPKNGATRRPRPAPADAVGHLPEIRKSPRSASADAGCAPIVAHSSLFSLKKPLSSLLKTPFREFFADFPEFLTRQIADARI